MLVNCPQCSTTYTLAPNRAKQRLAKIHCTACEHSWVQRFVAAPEPVMIERAPEPELSIETALFPETTNEAVTLLRAAPKRFTHRESRPAVQERSFFTPARRVAAAFCCLGLILTLVGKRDRVVAALPQMASLYSSVGLPVNLRGLQFREVKSLLSVDGSRRVLLVEGQIANIRPENSPVPDLRVSVQAEDGREVYHWTIPPPKMKIAAGEIVAFRTRLDASPVEGRGVKVAFAETAAKLASTPDAPAKSPSTSRTPITRSP